jgi:asparagine synthase (glutamine-hydrolysing)
MCGITGFINYGASDRKDTLQRMTDSIAHRGPDGEGVWLDDSVGLGHRRLAIIDLESGDQPMISSDGRFVTVFNGEIYNYRELREELKANGASFQTNSDTEVIAEAIRAWGAEKALREFRGMFAFAVWDKDERELTLARDRTGIKPLYYAETPNGTFFASEQKAILQAKEVERKIDSRGLYDTLTLGYPVTPDTCWKSIKLFPPASFAVLKPASPQLEHRHFWKWEFDPRPLELDTAMEKAETALADSLKYHLRSDVPLAAFLSGGIDSSLLVTILLKNGLIDKLRTFNVGFDDEAYDESADAKHVAELTGAIHTELRMGLAQGDPAEFERILSQYDEPYADSSCLPTYAISKEMRKHVKVVISGDGGDELFGGYSRFNHAATIDNFRMLPFKRLGAAIARFSAPMLGVGTARRIITGLEFAAADRNEIFTLLNTYFTEPDRKSILAPEFAEAARAIPPTWTRFNAFIPESAKNQKERMMGLELGLMLHGDYLRKVDIASSAHGLEVRVPFLDTEVLDLAASIPTNLKLNGKTTKFILRELARKKISDRIADKGKWGFGIPFDKWCQGEMMDYLRDLLFSKTADDGLWTVFKRSEGERLWKLFTDNTAAENARLNISRYQIYQRIFTMASIQIWFKKWEPRWK